MSKRAGVIVGDVKYSAGDGPELLIPRGPCDIEATSQDATISWREEEGSNVAALPIDTFTRYLTGGAITLERVTATP